MKPYYKSDEVTIYCGDYRLIGPHLPAADCIVADPPYGTTNLEWDELVDGWIETAGLNMKSNGSLWIFGTLRLFMENAQELLGKFRMVQDVVWEKHNGSNALDDRFKGVHEVVAQFCNKGIQWRDVYHNPQFTMDATARTIRTRGKTQHWSKIGEKSYTSRDGGPRMKRSVIYARSSHGNSLHPCQKPLVVVSPIVAYSCPAGGLLLEPFMGSGTAVVAAVKNGCRAIGVDKDERNCEIAVTRLRQGFIDLEVSLV